MLGEERWWRWRQTAAQPPQAASGEPNILSFVALTTEIISQKRTDLCLASLNIYCPQPSVQEEALNCQSQPRNQLYPVISSHPSRCKFNSSSSLVKILSPPIPTPRALSHNTQFCPLSSGAPLQDAQQVFILWIEKITGQVGTMCLLDPNSKEGSVPSSSPPNWGPSVG